MLVECLIGYCSLHTVHYPLECTVWYFGAILICDWALRTWTLDSQIAVSGCRPWKPQFMPTGSGTNPSFGKQLLSHSLSSLMRSLHLENQLCPCFKASLNYHWWCTCLDMPWPVCSKHRMGGGDRWDCLSAEFIVLSQIYCEEKQQDLGILH